MQYFLLHCIKNQAMSVDTQTASSTYWMRVRGGYPKLTGLILRGDSTESSRNCPLSRMPAMAETSTSAAPTAKSKPKAVAVGAPAFEMPKFDMPKFEMPKFEVPPAFREFAEKGVAQAKENYEKVKNAAEQATDVLEDTYSAASKGYADLGLKVIDNARANTNAAFDLYGELLTAKSYADVVEKSTAYARAQFESLTAQAKEFTEQAQKVVAATAEPVKGSISSFGKAV